MDFTEKKEQIISTINKYIGLAEIKSIALVGSCVKEKVIPLGADIDVCIFPKESTKEMIEKYKDLIPKIEEEINNYKIRRIDKLVIANPTKIWIDNSFSNKGIDTNMPHEKLKLDGWGNLASQFLKIYKVEAGKTIFGQQIIENLGVSSREIPKIEGYELFVVTKMELAEGLGSNNKYQIAKSFLRLCSAVIITETGMALTDYEHIRQAILSEFTDGDLVKNLVQTAYDIKVLNKEIDIDIKKVITCFCDIYMLQIIPFYQDYVLHLDKKDRVLYENMIKQFTFFKSIRIAEALSNQKLWDEIGIKLFYLFFDEIDKYLFNSIARRIDRFDEQTTQNKTNYHSKYINESVESDHCNLREKLKKFVSGAAKKKYDTIHINEIGKIEGIGVKELGWISTGLSHNIKNIKECTLINTKIIELAPELEVVILYNDAINFDSDSQFNKSIEKWEMLINKLEKKGVNSNFDLLIDTYKGLSITYMKAGMYIDNNFLSSDLPTYCSPTVLTLEIDSNIQTDEQIKDYLLKKSVNLKKEAVRILLDFYFRFDSLFNEIQREEILQDLFMILNMLDFYLDNVKLFKLAEYLKSQMLSRPILWSLLYSQIVFLTQEFGTENHKIEKSEICNTIDVLKSKVFDYDDNRLHELFARLYFIAEKYIESFEEYVTLISINKYYFLEMLAKFIDIDDSIFYQLKSVFCIEKLRDITTITKMQNFYNNLEEYANHKLVDFIIDRTHKEFYGLKRFKELFPFKFVADVPIKINEEIVFGKSILDDDFNNPHEYFDYLSKLKNGGAITDIQKVIDDLDSWALVLLGLPKDLQNVSYYKKQLELKDKNPSLYRKVDLYIGEVIQEYSQLLEEANVKYNENKFDISEIKYLDAIKILEEKKKIFKLVFGDEDYESDLRFAKVKLSDIYFDKYDFFIQIADFDQAKNYLDKFKEVFSLLNMTVFSNYIRLYNSFKMYDEAIQLITNTDTSILTCDQPNIDSLLSINIGDTYMGKLVVLLMNDLGEEKELIDCKNKALEYYLSAIDYFNSNDFPTDSRAIIENNIAFLSSTQFS